MKILGFFDANRTFHSGGALTTFQMQEKLKHLGAELTVLSFDDFRNYPFFISPSGKVALPTYREVVKEIEKRDFDAIHIFSEGPLSKHVVRYCQKKGLTFTSSYLTHLDIALEKWLFIPRKITQRWTKKHHQNAAKVFVPTPSLKEILEERGFSQEIVITGVGIDHSRFYYEQNAREFADLEKPIFISYGRISKEKSYEDFLDLDLPGSKVVVGEGRYKTKLEAKYKDRVLFLPHVKEMAPILSSADVFVFPTQFDTFGLVFVEALACGLPVAAYPRKGGPSDVIENGKNGFLSWDLKEAALNCLNLKKEDCIKTAENFEWTGVAKIFLENQVPARQEVLISSS